MYSERYKIVTDKEYFLSKFPNKSNLVVDYSLPELLACMLTIRDDININYIFKSYDSFKSVFKNNVEITNDKTGIFEGKLCIPKMFTEQDYNDLISLMCGRSQFVFKLIELHNKETFKFMQENNGRPCGNVLFHCTDSKFEELINSIDVQFTTVSNLLTSLRCGIIDSDTYGKIYVGDKIFIINLEESMKNNSCTGMYFDALKRD